LIDEVTEVIKEMEIESEQDTNPLDDENSS
jgi:hypothetical protein